MDLLDLIPIDKLTPIARLKRIRDELLHTINICKEQRLFGPALILLYSGTDIMASLIRPPNADEVRRDDFLRWAGDYILPDSNLNCTPIELYAARCSILHSLRYDSGLSRDGRARRIRYIFDNADVVRENMEELERQDTSLVVVDFDGLLQAFENGVERFLENIENNPQDNTIIIERINNELIFFPLLDTQ